MLASGETAIWLLFHKVRVSQRKTSGYSWAVLRTTVCSPRGQCFSLGEICVSCDGRNRVSHCRSQKLTCVFLGTPVNPTPSRVAPLIHAFFSQPCSILTLVPSVSGTKPGFPCYCRNPLPPSSWRCLGPTAEAGPAHDCAASWVRRLVLQWVKQGSS